MFNGRLPLETSVTGRQCTVGTVVCILLLHSPSAVGGGGGKGGRDVVIRQPNVRKLRTPESTVAPCRCRCRCREWDVECSRIGVDESPGGGCDRRGRVRTCDTHIYMCIYVSILRVSAPRIRQAGRASTHAVRFGPVRYLHVCVCVCVCVQSK